jgi:hypothetical protein
MDAWLGHETLFLYKEFLIICFSVVMTRATAPVTDEYKYKPGKDFHLHYYECHFSVEEFIGYVQMPYSGSLNLWITPQNFAVIYIYIQFFAYNISYYNLWACL